MSPKIKIVGCGSRGHVPKSRNHRNDGFLGSPKSKSKKYKTKSKQNHSLELLSLLFPSNFHKNAKRKNVPKVLFLLINQSIISSVDKLPMTWLSHTTRTCCCGLVAGVLRLWTDSWDRLKVATGCDGFGFPKEAL